MYYLKYPSDTVAGFHVAPKWENNTSYQLFVFTAVSWENFLPL